MKICFIGFSRKSAVIRTAERSPDMVQVVGAEEAEILFVNLDNSVSHYPKGKPFFGLTLYIGQPGFDKVLDAQENGALHSFCLPPLDTDIRKIFEEARKRYLESNQKGRSSD